MLHITQKYQCSAHADGIEIIADTNEASISDQLKIIVIR